MGIPVLVLWALSKATQSGAHHFVLSLVAAPSAMAAFSPFLFWLNGLYLRLTGAGDDEPGARRRRVPGPLEPLLLWSLVISVAALFVWFFFFAENPPRQFL